MTSDSRQYTGPEWDHGSPAAHGPVPEVAPGTHSDPMSPPWASGPPQGPGWSDQPVAGRASVGWDPGAAAGPTPPWAPPEPAPAQAPGHPFPPPWPAESPGGPVPAGGAAGPAWEDRQPASPAVTTPSAPAHQPVSSQPEQPHPAAVPLPPQPTRVPGASLAASPPPGDFPLAHVGHPGVAAPDHFGGQPSGQAQVPWTPENSPGHGAQSRPVARATVPSPRLPHDAAPGNQGDNFAPFATTGAAPAGHATVPSADASMSAAQNTTPTPEPAEARPSGVATVSASASVPTANRIAPPADYNPQPASAPRSRVYGRPATEPPADPAPYGRPAAEPPADPALYGRPVAEPAADPYDRAVPEPPASPAPYDRPVTEPTPASPPYHQDVPSAGYAPTSQPPFGPHPVSPGPIGAAPDVPPPGADSGASNPPWASHGEAGGFPGRAEAPSSNLFPPQPEVGTAPPWAQSDIAEQERFNTFQSEPEPAEASDAPPKRERNGRVLLLTILAALLVLGIPLGILTLIGKIGGGSAAFNPAVGECVKQSGTSAVAADCSEPGAHTVVSKVDDASKCEDPNQPYVALSGGNSKERVLCLGPAHEPAEPGEASPESTTDG